MAEDIKFLGRGWSFPPSFNRSLNRIELSSGNKDIVESLHILLSTMPGERFMEPNYGCDLTELMFESLSTSLKTRLKDKIRTAIIMYETRIKLNDISFELDSDEGVVFIHLTYTIRSINTRTNMVFPYYLKEGTDIKK